MVSEKNNKKMVKVSLYMPTDLWDAIKNISNKEGIKSSHYIRRVIRRALKEKEMEKKVKVDEDS